MNSTAIDIGSYNTPYAFGKHKQQFIDFITRDGKKIISQDFYINDELLECKFNEYIIQNLFNVKLDTLIQKKQRLVGPIRNHLKNIFRLLDSGLSKQDAIIKIIKECSKKIKNK